MTSHLFNYSSVVVDDLAASGKVYETIGTPKVWAGEHPFFHAKAAVYATQKGGALLIERSGKSHPAVEAYAGAKERNFHIGLLVDDLEAQRKACAGSRFKKSLSDIYAGPSGKSFVVELEIGGGNSLWLEFTEGLANFVQAPGSPFECVDSTAMVAAKRSDVIEPLESIGLKANKKASDGFFDVLAGINAVVMLDWHYLEVNEPTDQQGAMTKFLQRIGRPGIFGTNFVPRDMAAFVARAKEKQIDTNTEQPIRLMVEVRGTKYTCADIVTINPRATGGARVFILKPLDYPWKLAA